MKDLGFISKHHVPGSFSETRPGYTLLQDFPLINNGLMTCFPFVYMFYSSTDGLYINRNWPSSLGLSTVKQYYSYYSFRVLLILKKKLFRSTA